MSPEAFDTAKGSADGYIVIRDKTKDRPNRVHLPGCRTVKRGDFITKVMMNERKNGDYHFCRDFGAALGTAQDRWDSGEAGACPICNPIP